MSPEICSPGTLSIGSREGLYTWAPRQVIWYDYHCESLGRILETCLQGQAGFRDSLRLQTCGPDIATVHCRPQGFARTAAYKNLQSKSISHWSCFFMKKRTYNLQVSVTGLAQPSRALRVRKTADATLPNSNKLKPTNTCNPPNRAVSPHTVIIYPILGIILGAKKKYK